MHSRAATFLQRLLAARWSSRFSGARVLDGRGASRRPVRHAAHVDADAQLDSWIAVAADGTVTAYTGKCELGQGMLTAQMQLVAEELCVPLARVR